MPEFLKRWARFCQYVGYRFSRDHHSYRAAALTFTSLLSMVPLLSVSFSILTIFPVFSNVGQQIEDFIFENFVASSGKVVQSYLEQFVDKVQHLSPIGLVFLLLTAPAQNGKVIK